MLELRLDNIVYRLGFAPTIQASRQMVQHRHILVNNQAVNIPSFQCTVGDKITISPRSNLVETLEIMPNNTAKYLDLISSKNNKQHLGLVKQLPTRSDTDLEINELFIVEYYSR